MIFGIGYVVLFFLSFLNIAEGWTDEISDSAVDPSASFLSFSRQLPINVNYENRLLIERLAHKEPAKNVAIQNARTIPWELFGILVVGCLIYVWYRLFYTPGSQEQKRLLDAREEVLQVFGEIQKSPSEKLYTELTNQVRTYMEQRYKINASRQTTQEFLETVPKTFPREQLQRLLVLSDNIKFAQGHLPKDHLDKVWNVVDSILKE